MRRLMQPRRRWFAAGWFAAAAALAVLANPLFWWVVAKPLSDPRAWSIILEFVFVPCLCAAAVACCFGADILDASRVRSTWWAMLHGIRVAILALLLYLALITLYTDGIRALGSLRDLISSPASLLTGGLLVLIVFGLPVMFLGAVAGIGLYLLRGRLPENVESLAG